MKETYFISFCFVPNNGCYCLDEINQLSRVMDCLVILSRYESAICSIILWNSYWFMPSLTPALFFPNICLKVFFESISYLYSILRISGRDVSVGRRLFFLRCSMYSLQSASMSKNSIYPGCFLGSNSLKNSVVSCSAVFSSQPRAL